MKKNLVIYTLPRVGSTYVGGSLYLFKKNHPTNPIHSNTMWLDELFKTTTMKPRLAACTFDENNKVEIDHKIFCQSKSLPEMTKIPDLPAEKKCAKDVLEKFMLINQRPYVVKIHGGHHKRIDNERLKFVIESRNEETSLCFLYRRDVEDILLSWIVATTTTLWNTNDVIDVSQKNSFYTGVSIEVDELFFELFLNNILEQIYDHQYNRSKEYPWDLIICYEDLTGDPVVDFQPYFDYPLSQTEITEDWMPSKLLTKDEKISMIKDYPAFKKLLLQKLNELNMPLFLDRI
jgi:hypothetical protein